MKFSDISMDHNKLHPNTRAIKTELNGVKKTYYVHGVSQKHAENQFMKTGLYQNTGMNII